MMVLTQLRGAGKTAWKESMWGFMGYAGEAGSQPLLMSQLSSLHDAFESKAGS